MPTKVSHKKNLLIISILVLISVILLPLKFENHVKIQGRIRPIQEWQLISRDNGTLQERLINNFTGSAAYTRSLVPDRGDQVTVVLNPELINRAWIPAGFTIGSIISADINRRQAELTGELDVARANLQVYESSEKPAVLEEARLRLTYAETVLARQAKIMERNTVLHDKNLISEEQFEEEESKYSLDLLNVEIARERLNSLETGAKTEQLDLEKTRILSLQKQIDALGGVDLIGDLTSPVSGEVTHYNAPDTLVRILDTSRITVAVPILMDQVTVLDETDSPRITAEVNEEEVDVNEYFLDAAIHTIAGKQVKILNCQLSNEGELLPPGDDTIVHIYGAKISGFEHLKRFFN